MYTLYETNYTEYNRKMKEMVTNYGIRRPEGCTNTGLNCTFQDNTISMDLVTHSHSNLNFLIKLIHYLLLPYSCTVTSEGDQLRFYVSLKLIEVMEQKELLTQYL